MIPPDRRILPAAQATLIDQRGVATQPMYDFMRRIVEATALTPEILQQIQDLLAQFAALEAAIADLDLSLYTKRAANELISGEWTFLQQIQGADGTAERPEYSFRDDDDSGFYRLGDDNVGIATGEVARWDVDTTRVFQSLPLTIQNDDGLYIQPENPLTTIEGLRATVQRVGEGADVILGFWEGQVGSNDTGFRLVMNGAPAGDAEFSLYRHDEAGVASKIFNVLRESGGIDFLEQVRALDGTAGAPSYSFTSDPNTGVFNTAADNIGVSTGGSLRWTFGTAAHVSTLPIRGQSGAANAPMFTFTGDTNTGMYRLGNGQIGLTTLGTNRFTLTTTELTLTLPYQGPSQSAGTPTFSWSGDPNTGMYNVGADNLGFSAGGTLRFDISTTALTSTLPFLGPAGSAAAPTYSFSGDPNTGLWGTGGDVLNFSTGGSTRFGLGSAGEILDASGSAGTTGQVPTSGGAGAAWSWSTPSGGGGGSSLSYVNTTIPTGNTIASTAAETAFDSSYDIPANTLIVGTLVRVRAMGTFSTTGTPTLQLRIKLDSTTYIDTMPVTTPSGASDEGWVIDGTFVVHTTGATGTVEAQGVAQFADAVVDAPRTAAVTTDTTQALTVTVTAQWGTSSASNTITLRELAIWTEDAVSAQGAAAASKTYLTVDDESATLPNSRRQLAGLWVSMDDTVASRRTVNIGLPNRVWQAQPGGIGVIGGNALTTFGTISSPAVSTGSTVGLYMVRRRSASTTAANNTGTFRWAPGDHDVYAAATPSGAAGFALRTRFGLPSIVAGERLFVGVASAGIAGSADPSSLTNIICVGKDGGDTNLHFMHNDGSGTATKVNLGVALTANTTYDLVLSIPRGGGSCAYSLTDLDTGTIYSGSVSTDLPASNTGLIYILQGSVGASGGTAISVDFGSLEVRYPL